MIGDPSELGQHHQLVRGRAVDFNDSLPGRGEARVGEARTTRYSPPPPSSVGEVENALDRVLSQMRSASRRSRPYANTASRISTPYAIC